VGEFSHIKLVGEFSHIKLNSHDSLLEIMDEISQEAINKGLTPEILQSLLEDE
jgi:hypothetical protein